MGFPLNPDSYRGAGRAIRYKCEAFTNSIKNNYSMSNSSPQSGLRAFHCYR